MALPCSAASHGRWALPQQRLRGRQQQRATAQLLPNRRRRGPLRVAANYDQFSSE